jgi:hypothetical protein
MLPRPHEAGALVHLLRADVELGDVEDDAPLAK